MSNSELVLHLFLQLAVILAACRLVGIVGRRLGQSQVVCEMIAGVLLGPSLFGLLAPAAQQWLFPMKITIGETSITHPSMAILYILSQVALALYMFLVGLEFDTNLIRGRSKHATIISSGGILAPFILGGALAFVIYQQNTLFGSKVTPWMAALFLGAAMSITSFPMLARILQEHHVARTKLGTLVLTAAAVDDISAWCLLAIVLASIEASPIVAVITIVGGLLYTLLSLTIGKRALSVFGPLTERKATVTKEMLSVVLLILLLCSWFTTAIGIGQIFGAFVLGVAMPRGRFADELRRRMEYITTGLLLPIFFVYSGLNTQLRLVNTPALWLITGAIILAATLGKGIACALGARLVGHSWRESATIGSLMNARGLIELIMLNIGLQEGIITSTLFTILVFMAIVTTLMASPLFRLFYKPAGEPASSVSGALPPPEATPAIATETN